MSRVEVVSKPVGYYKSPNYLPNHEGEDYAAYSAKNAPQSKTNQTKKQKNTNTNTHTFTESLIL